MIQQEPLKKMPKRGPEPLWAGDVAALGPRNALLSRMKRHGGTTISEATRMTGMPRAAVRRELKALAHDGLALCDVLEDELYYQCSHAENKTGLQSSRAQ